MSEFALSTSWNALRHDKAETMMGEVLSAGFDSVELNFALTSQMVYDISSMVREGRIRVKSLHNYCPIPDGVKREKASPDYYSISSLDEEERRMAIYFTKRTIEAAAGLSAECVILHCGRVATSDPTHKLITLYEEGRKDSREFVTEQKEMSSERRSKVDAHMERLFLSLDQLNSYAQERGIILGIENRYYFMEIPSFEEIGLILKKFEGTSVCYWHDIGHAQVGEELGFGSHIGFLRKYSRHMSGMHFHDIKGTDDHIAPGRGNFNFSLIKPFLSSTLKKIIEVHRTESIEDLRLAKAYLQKIL